MARTNYSTLMTIVRSALETNSTLNKVPSYIGNIVALALREPGLDWARIVMVISLVGLMAAHLSNIEDGRKSTNKLVRTVAEVIYKEASDWMIDEGKWPSLIGYIKGISTNQEILDTLLKKSYKHRAHYAGLEQYFV